LKPLILDQLLDAIRDVEIMLLVLKPNISRLEVAVLCDRVLRRVRLVPVTLEDVRALEPELAGLARAELRTLGRDVLGGHVGEHLADGADRRIPFFPWLDSSRKSLANLLIQSWKGKLS
jgi:hypothetical protein